MTSSLLYDQTAIKKLDERTQYEVYLLEAVYSIVEDDLFPEWPDAVFYPINGQQPIFVGHGRMNCVIGDWRPSFLTVGAPLVFVTTFKLLDMLVEWILEHNGQSVGHRFEQKIKALASTLMLPAVLEKRPWFYARLVGLYRNLEPLRGTIIHQRHFRTSDGTIFVSSSKGGTVGPEISISGAKLRSFAVVAVSMLRYIEGAWDFHAIREKTMRHTLDNLAELHGLSALGQKQPYHPTVRFYSLDPDPTNVDIHSIRQEVAQQYPDLDVTFDLRVVVVNCATAGAAYLFPWSVLDNDGLLRIKAIDIEQYRIDVPQDIDASHLATG